MDGIVGRALAGKQITYDADDSPAAGEVMVEALLGIDQHFQSAAPWSLERAVKAIAATGKPATLDRKELQRGGWTFYVLRGDARGKTATVIRATSPTRALKHGSRTLTHFVGGELRPMKDPLVGVDHDADAVVFDGNVYIFRPQRLERLFIDAEEVKARAPQIAAKFSTGLSAALSSNAATFVEKACSENSNVGRRVERLNRTGQLSSMTVPLLRAGLKDAKLHKDDFGKGSNMIDVTSVDHAIALIDIAADLYYQPRFEKTSRKVASFRRL
ncbi:MAG: Kiwa anti-phage protein KwaB-like domain-containing protein [Solirubrobacteraceae bacterium]